MKPITIFLTVFIGGLLFTSERGQAFLRENKIGLVVGVLLIGGFYLLEYVLKNFVNIPQARQSRLDLLDKILQKYGQPAGKPLPRLASEEKFTEIAYERERAIVIAAGAQIIEKHIDVLVRKRKQLLFNDDYGRKQRNAWEKELVYFVRNILLPEINEELSIELTSPTAIECMQDTKYTIEFWASYADDLSAVAEEFQETDVTDEFDELMSGHEYEHYVADLIRQAGWEAKVTSGSGDHGADIIAEKDGIRVAIQCKLYSSAVGNKSVQEAFSAQGFYDCHKSCVVTNNTFTNAARKAAYKLNVSLLHHDKLCDFLAELA